MAGGYQRLALRLEPPGIPMGPLDPPSASLTPSSRDPSEGSADTILLKDHRRHDRRRERLNTELLLAVFASDYQRTLALLDQGASPEATCRPGRVTAGHVAAWKGHPEILANLLMRGADPGLRDRWGRQPAHLAAWGGRAPILDILHAWEQTLLDSPIATEPDPPPCDLEVSDSWSHDHDALTHMVPDELVEGSTPLHLACRRAHKECVNLLLSKGVRIDAKDEQGLTPLDVVGASQDEQTELDSSPHPPSSPEPTHPAELSYDSIPIEPRLGDPTPKLINKVTRRRAHFHVKEYHEKKSKPVHDIISSLLDKGAKLPKSNVILKEGAVQNQTKLNVTTLHTAVESQDEELIELLLKKNACMMTWNDRGETAIHLAVKKMLVEPLQKMLGWEVEQPVVDVRDILGRTPLHLAVMQEWPMGVSLLLEAGAEIKATTNDSETVLHMAAERGNYVMLEELLSIPDAKKVLEYRDRDYCTPLLRAAYHDRSQCVELLIRHGADPVITLPGDFTLLHIATENNSCEIIQLLLRDESTAKRLRDVRCKEERGGLTALHIAAKYGYEECVRELLVAGCDVLTPTTRHPENLTTALHLAGMCGQVDVVKCILELDADKTLKTPDGSGRLPLHVAALHGQGPCVKLMLLSGADIAAVTMDDIEKKTGLDEITYSVPQPLIFLEDIFDSYIVSNGFPVNHPECEIEVKYDILIPHGTCEKQMNVLNSILNSGRRKLQEKLLLHPIVETFLCLKWQKLRIFFFVLMMFYFLHTLSITSLSFLHYVIKGYSPKVMSIFIIISQILLVISFIPILITEILNVSQLQKYYLRDYETWVKWCVFIGTWAFGVTNPGVWWARYVASITVLLAWIELLFFIARCPSWGYYVLMFSRVAVNVFKVLGTFIFLLMGFTFSFMIHFQSSQPFQGLWEAVVKVLVMMIELDYSGTFEEDDKSSPGEELVDPTNPTTKEDTFAFFLFGRAIFAIFVILVAIVLTNLMVGLAVSDINLLETQGRTQRLAKQVDFLSLMEIFVYNDMVMKCLPRQLSRAIEKRRCVNPCVLIKPVKPLGKDFREHIELPRDIRDAVLEKVASQQLRDESVEVSVSLQRIDERVENLASIIEKRRSSFDSNTSKKSVKDNQNIRTEQMLVTVLQELAELRNTVQSLKQNPPFFSRTDYVLTDDSKEPGPLLV